MINRPKRKAIPLSVKVEICLRLLGIDPADVQWDHAPALELRPVNDDGTDFDPPQHSAAHIQPLSRAAHAAKTNGPAHDKSQSDKGRIAHTKRLERSRFDIEVQVATLGADSLLSDWHPSIYAASKPKRAWPKGRRIESRGFQRKERK